MQKSVLDRNQTLEEVEIIGVDLANNGFSLARRMSFN